MFCDIRKNTWYMKQTIKFIVIEIKTSDRKVTMQRGDLEESIMLGHMNNVVASQCDNGQPCCKKPKEISIQQQVFIHELPKW